MKLSPINLEPGDKILCDPTYSDVDLADNKKPNCTIPANVLSVNKANVLVEIIDAIKPNGHRDFSNSDEYGSTCLVLIQAIHKHTA
jgi:hypothetical protein